MRTSIPLLLVGLLIGLGVGWYISPGPFRYYYRTTKEITVLSDAGLRIGTVPSGSPLVTDEELLPTADLGWWGYVPIQFDTRDVALELGVVAGQKPASIKDFALRAEFDYLHSARERQMETPLAGVKFEVFSVRVMSNEESKKRSPPDVIGLDAVVRCRVSSSDREVWLLAAKGPAILTPLGHAVRVTPAGIAWRFGSSTNHGRSCPTPSRPPFVLLPGPMAIRNRRFPSADPIIGSPQRGS